MTSFTAVELDEGAIAGALTDHDLRPLDFLRGQHAEGLRGERSEPDPSNT
jgi:hypothetical protein